MTTSAPALAPTTSSAAWDEPEGVAARGTVVVLTGRGETARSYERLGRRISSDAYRVRVVQVELDDPDATRDEVRGLLADASLPRPRVVLGSDSGATRAQQLAVELEGPEAVDGLVLAGLALPGPGADAAPQAWEDELEARTACPAHRRVLSGDDDFARGALGAPLPAAWGGLAPVAPDVPVLVLHGTEDPVTPPQDAFAPFRGRERARLHAVVGGRHDVLNDVSHRSVAATVVLFLESLRLAPDLPVVVELVQG